jgi:3-oxoacyl-[acyl-carrier-protein] synthase-3
VTLTRDAVTPTRDAVTPTEVGIGAIRCILPEKREAVTDLTEFPALGHDEAEFARGSGVSTVGVFDGTTAAELTARACRDLVADGARQPDSLVVVAPRAPEVLLGSDACRVQAEAGLGSAFAVADPTRQAVMIAHGSRPTGLDRIRYPVTVIGDGAYAMTVVRGGRPVLRAHRMQTDGTFHDLFRVDYKRAPWYEWREECQSPDRYRFDLAMHSRLRIGALVEAVLADAGVDRRAVAATLMQNVTAGAFDFYEKLLGLAVHDVCRGNLAQWGHLGAMDVVLNLHHLLSGGAVAPGDLVLVLNNSPVAAWAVTLWEV